MRRFWCGGWAVVDFDEQTVQLMPGEMLTVDRGVRHRTRPVGERFGESDI